MTHGLFKHINLKWTIILTVLLPLFCIAGATVYFMSMITKKELQQQVEQQVELVARALHDPVLLSLQDKKNHFKRILSSTEQIRRFYTINIFDNQNRLLWTSDKNKETVDPRLSIDPIIRKTSQNTYTKLDDRSIYTHFEPVFDPSSAVVGLIQITREKRNIKNVTLNAITQISIIYGIAVLLVFLFTTVLYRILIQKPFDHLAAKLYGINFTDPIRSQRIHIEGPSEFKIIESAFNTLHDKLIDHHNQIKYEQSKQLILQDKIKQSEKLAAIGTLAAGVAHDLGNPISAIDATVQRLENKASLPQTDHRYLGYIKREISRLENIIQKLLNFSEDQKIYMQETNIVNVAEQLQASFYRQWPNIFFNWKYKIKEVSMKIDKAKVEQTLTNLVVNAVESIETLQTKTKIVLLKFIETSDHLYFIVEDSGTGIEDKNKSIVFEPFLSHRKKGNKRNKGLGLSIVHGIVQSLKGTIRIENSKKLGGARFVIQLPKHI